MENDFKNGEYVLVKCVVDYGNATPGKMVRVHIPDNSSPVWVAPENIIRAHEDKCDGKN